MQTHNKTEATEDPERNILLGLHYLAREANGARLSRLATLIRESIHGYLFEGANNENDERWH
jgi:hypothetical protein